MLAYYVEWHMRERLKPLLFDDEDPAAAEAARQSVVAPAQVSESAQRKAMTKRTADGLPTQQLVVRLARFAARRSDRDPLNLNPDSSVELGRQMRCESANSIRASRREVLHQQAGCKAATCEPETPNRPCHREASIKVNGHPASDIDQLLPWAFTPTSS